MFAKPQAEHQWLDQLLGQWSVESDCRMPDQPPMTALGKATVRSLGGLWNVTEMEGKSPEGGSWESIMTLGFDPAVGRYVGTFVGSMMAHLWAYSGSLDATKRKLVLDTSGPNFENTGTTQYQDIVEVVDSDHWVLHSQILLGDGTWLPFMSAHHRRMG